MTIRYIGWPLFQISICGWIMMYNLSGARFRMELRIYRLNFLWQHSPLYLMIFDIYSTKLNNTHIIISLNFYKSCRCFCRQVYWSDCKMYNHIDRSILSIFWNSLGNYFLTYIFLIYIQGQYLYLILLPFISRLMFLLLYYESWVWLSENMSSRVKHAKQQY